MRTPHMLAIVALMGLAPLSALAQGVDRTGTGGGPATTARAPFTTSTGQTVPRPAALDPTETGSIQRRSRLEVRNDAITQGICIGCGR